MNKLRPTLFLLCLLLAFLLQLVGLARAGGAEQSPLPLLDAEGGVGKHVIILPIEGTIDLGLAPFVRRVVAEESDAAAIILDIDTFGGRVDAAVQIRDALLAAKVPTIAFIDRRAISAGALIAYATDTIVFAPGSSMGAATPIEMRGGEAEAVDEKFVSYMRAEMRATAEAKGRRGDIAEAMVDRTLAVEGVIEAGKLLTVTTDTALALGLADGSAQSMVELLEAVGLSRAERESVEPNWAEEIARIVTDPTVSGLLMSLGMLGLLMELYTPGFGITGAIGVSCLTLFFCGHMIADLAGWEEMLLLFVGAGCLAVEILWLPGFGVVGLAGIVLVVLGLSLSLVGTPLGAPHTLTLIASAIGRVLISTALTLVGIALVASVFPARALPGWLVLRARLGKETPEIAADEATFRAVPEQGALLGRRGVALTDLRLSGKAQLNAVDGATGPGSARIVDVVSRYDYIDKGTDVVVTEVEGVRVVVERVVAEPPAAPLGSETA